LVTVVTQVDNAGKVPVIPTLVASKSSNIQRNGPAANEKIRLLYVNHSEVIPGPDLWALFTDHPGWISGDNLHPTETGYGEIRKAWADSALSSVYAAG
jgi:lysophospholipase L1-like esterase